MNIREARNILIDFRRCDNNDIEMPDVDDWKEALDIAIEVMKDVIKNK